MYCAEVSWKIFENENVCPVQSVVVEKEVRTKECGGNENGQA